MGYTVDASNAETRARESAIIDISQSDLPIDQHTEPPIAVTDELIDTYRSRFNLNARAWQDPIVRGYVLALSRRLTIASMMHWQQVETDITATLAHFEPLEEIREHSYAGSVLWIAFNAYCARDVATTQAAIGAALRMWPGDTRLVRMREALITQERTSYNL